jgi:hypothetical protein
MEEQAKTPLQKATRWAKILLKALIGLGISVGLTVVALAFIPSAFKFGLDLTLNLLSENKFTIYQVSNRQELVEHFDLQNPNNDDHLLFDQLSEKFDKTRQRDTFYARMFVALDHPNICQYTFIGKHRLYDIAWVVQANECHKKHICKDKSKKECKALMEQYG